MAASAAQNEWVKSVLGVDIGAEQEGDELDLDDLGLDLTDLWQGARSAFDMATETVDRQIGELQKVLRASNDDELEEIAEFGLNALTGNTRVPLMAALMEAGNGEPEKMKVAAPKVTKAVAAFRAQIDGDPKIAAVDNNPFGIEVSIRDTYGEALERLEDAASTIAAKAA